MQQIAAFQNILSIYIQIKMDLDRAFQSLCVVILSILGILYSFY